MFNKEEYAKIIILGEVQSQLRPIFNSKTRKAIDPKKCRDYKALVSLTTKKYYQDNPLDEPLRVEVDIYRSIPKSWSNKKKEMAKNGELFPTSKPDTENLSKGILDGMSGLVWRDDSIIIEHEIKKFYSTVPRAEVRVYRMNN